MKNLQTDSNSKIELKNYLDLLIDEDIDKISKCPICISGISEILKEIYKDLKKYYKGNEFQKLLKKESLFGIYHWKENYFPIPITKIKKLLKFWRIICNKSKKDVNELYERVYLKSQYFSAQKSPVKIKAIKMMTPKLAYLLGVLYADGALRNIWLTKENKGRFQYEITITEEHKKNLEKIVRFLNELFQMKTNVKEVYGGRWHRIIFSSLVLHRILNKIFNMPMGYKKGKLRIPKLVKESPFNIRKYFVIGFFDGDGMCSRISRKRKYTTVLSVSQSSKEILMDLNEIFLKAGLNFNLFKKKREKFSWVVLETKNKKQIKKYQELFGFLYNNKRKRLKKLVESFNLG